MSNIKLEEMSKNIITEFSALSGYPQAVVKECFEYLFVDWSIRIADTLANNMGSKDCPEIPIGVPFLGTIFIKYEGDKILETGELDTELSYRIEFLPSFRKLVGDIVDEGYTEIVPLLSKKIENAIMVASTE